MFHFVCKFIVINLSDNSLLKIIIGDLLLLDLLLCFLSGLLLLLLHPPLPGCNLGGGALRQATLGLLQVPVIYRRL